MNLIGLANTGRKKAGKFSLGMKQRLGLGMAIITNPEFLILDEPTNGLDPDGIKELLDLINSLKQKGITILISSHQLHEVSKIVDDIVILHQGKIHYNQPNQDKQDLEKLFFSIVHGGYEKMRKILQSECLKQKHGAYFKLCLVLPFISLFIAFLLCGPTILESFFNLLVGSIVLLLWQDCYLFMIIKLKKELDIFKTHFKVN